MALTYTGPDGIFTHIGQVIKAVNACAGDLTAWNTRESNIQTAFETGGQRAAVNPLIGYVNQVQAATASMRNTLGNLVTARLQDGDSVITQLAIASADLTTVLSGIIKQMVLDSASVNASTVTVDTITAASGNVGTGTILTDLYLDGYAAPASGAAPHPAYAGRLSEFSVPETMTFRCTQDSYSDSSTPGQENFTWNGQIALANRWSEGVEGSGNGPSLRTLQASTIISGMGFESWATTNIPDGWTIDNGAATTNVAREASTKYRGNYGVKFIGTGAAAAITLGQAVPASRLRPLRRYCCSLRYRASLANTAGQTFTVKFTGTGYTAGATEKIEIAGNDLATSWTLVHFWVTMPAALPSDMRLIISFTGTPTVNLFIDDLGFGEATYHNGIAAAVVAGSTNFVRGDSFFTAVTVSPGVIQNYFRRQYGVCLPSVDDGSETIEDSLAT
ncbi:MAG: hypothetical protein V4719_24230 [Planctomycetota bacterium]